VTIPADAVFSRSNHAPIKLPVLWLHHHLHAMLVDKFVPLFTSRLFEGEMELDVRSPQLPHAHAHAPPHACTNAQQRGQPGRATDPSNIEANRERLQTACNAILDMCRSLQLSAYALSISLSISQPCSSLVLVAQSH
jgi:hypothetical protein